MMRNRKESTPGDKPSATVTWSAKIGTAVMRGAGAILDMLYSNLWMGLFYMLQLGGVALYLWSADGRLELSVVGLLRGLRSAAIPALTLMALRGFILWGKPRMWRRLIAGLVTTLTVAACMVETWMSWMLHTRWSDRIIRLIADTNPGESGEFLSLYFFTPKSLGILLGHLLLTGIIYHGLRAAGRAMRLHRSKGERIARRLLVIATIGAGIWWWSLPPENDYNAENSLNTFHRMQKMLAVHQRTLKNIKALEKTPRLADGHIREGIAPPAHIIWVIGESDSKAHWSLYGYGLPTTPSMERRAAAGELIRYDDVICFEPRTYRMMEILFSPYVVTEKSALYLKNPLTPMLLRKAGYRVRLHDNQATLVRGDDQAEVGTSNFMNSRILSEANFDWRNDRMYRYDLDLLEAALPMLHDADTVGNRPTVDIFHLNGQHFSAVNRYPAGFGRFTEADYPARTELSAAERRQVAEYDNATLYVDAWLDRLMEEMKDEDVVIIYHPDHGEEMNDERHCSVRTMDSHKLPESAPYVLEIPFVVYASEKFRTLHPDLYSRLKSAATEKQSLIYFSHYLLDVAEVESKYRRPELSPLSPEWRRPPRVVKEIGTYDKWLEKHRKN